MVVAMREEVEAVLMQDHGSEAHGIGSWSYERISDWLQPERSEETYSSSSQQNVGLWDMGTGLAKPCCSDRLAVQSDCASHILFDLTDENANL